MMAGQGYWTTKDGDVRIWFLGGTKGQSTDFANLRIRLLGRKRKERGSDWNKGWHESPSSLTVTYWLTTFSHPQQREREREIEFKLESFEVRVIKDCTARGRNWYVAWGRNEIGDGPNIIEPALSGLLDNSVVNSKLVKLDTVLRTFNVNRHTPGSTIVSNSERWFDNWYGSPIVDRITRMDLIANRI